MRHAKGREEGSLLIGARGREDFGAGPECQLDGGKANAAGCRMYQHAFAALQPGQNRATRMPPS